MWFNQAQKVDVYRGKFATIDCYHLNFGSLTDPKRSRFATRDPVWGGGKPIIWGREGSGAVLFVEQHYVTLLKPVEGGDTSLVPTEVIPRQNGETITTNEQRTVLIFHGKTNDVRLFTDQTRLTHHTLPPSLDREVLHIFPPPNSDIVCREVSRDAESPQHYIHEMVYYSFTMADGFRERWRHCRPGLGFSIVNTSVFNLAWIVVITRPFSTQLTIQVFRLDTGEWIRTIVEKHGYGEIKHAKFKGDRLYTLHICDTTRYPTANIVRWSIM
jgi:hypothetical protein